MELTDEQTKALKKIEYLMDNGTFSHVLYEERKMPVRKEVMQEFDLENGREVDSTMMGIIMEKEFYRIQRI